MSSNQDRAGRFTPNDVEAGATGKPKVKRKTSKPSREEMQAAMRARAHSNGSTLGAFYQHETPKAKETPKAHPPGPRKRRPSKKHSHDSHPPASQKPPPAVISAPQPSPYQMQFQAPLPASQKTGSDLGDVASMAFAGLGDIDFTDIVGGMGGAPPATRKDPSAARANAATAPPPARRIPRPMPHSSGSKLATIKDDSEAHHDVSGTPGRQSNNRRSNNIRASTATVDSLRVSDVSAGEVADMLSSLDRDNSMFLSQDSGFGLGNETRESGRPSARNSLLGSSILDKQPPSVPTHTKAPSQQEEIASFAAMLHAGYGAADDAGQSHPLTSQGPPPAKEPSTIPPPKKTFPYSSTTSSEEEGPSAVLEEEEELIEHRQSQFLDVLDPTHWLAKDVKFGEDGVPYFEESTFWTAAGLVRHLLYNPISPEFTSLQQFCWSINLGILMGVYTAVWKEIIEFSVELMWKEIPELLLEKGMFTDLDGSFPLYHYMWICPAFWGGLLSYIFVILPTPIPGQNEWIQSVHTMGVQDSETFFYLFVLSTLGMASGLSLGPELPLVLTAGMIGSWLGVQCKQSVLQARVMNITCASAAIGGFFGFPMAGALFVMEIPHRMGLQYFEALSPATFASIVAVLCNRLITNNDVTGYYR